MANVKRHRGKRVKKREPEPFALSELRDNTVRIASQNGSVVYVPLRLKHSVWTGETELLDFFSPCDSQPPIVHVFSLFPEDETWSPLSAEERAAVMSLQPPVVTEGESPTDNEVKQHVASDVILAKLTVNEYPDSWRSAAGAGWYDLIDGSEGVSGGGLMLDMIMGIVDEQLVDDGYEPVLIGGSLFIYRMLEVHPSLRSQRLGARLMAHALKSLPRTIYDVSACIAFPDPTIWDSLDEEGHRRRGDTSREAVERLANYYERLGWMRWRSKHVRRGSPTPLWIHHACKLPFDRESTDG